MDLKYNRILLKLSGEALMGNAQYGIDAETVKFIASEIKPIYVLGVKIGIVISDGNIFRGVSPAAKGMDRVTADHMGMLATVINCLSVQNALEMNGIETRVQSAIEMRQIAEFYIKDRAIRHLEKGRVVIFGAGSGNPYFSTDTAAALRAAEIEADVILLAKNVDGVYNKDPKKYDDAKKYDEVSYMQSINEKLGVMDTTAITLCMENNIPILVFALNEEESIKRAVKGEKIGTIIKE